MKKFYKSLSRAKLGLFALALTVFSGAVYSQTTYTFNYTGGQQTIALQPGTYTIETWGADGGNNLGNGSTTYLQNGGKGGYSVGTYTLASTTTIYVNVGGIGSNSTSSLNVTVPGGYNGGGYGSANTASGKSSGAGGGGASHVATATGTLGALVSNQSAVLIVAGGGGGAGESNYVSSNTQYNSNGGYGGGLSGLQNITTGYQGRQGQGGTQTAGGGGGDNGSAVAGPPLQGIFGAGGYNTTANGNTSAGGSGAGGGGGGWYGGGAGWVGATGFQAGSGGGGSGYIGGVSNGTTVVLGQPGFVPNPDVTGNGRVLIKELCSISLYAAGNTNSLNPMICSGQSATLMTNAISNYSWSTGATTSSLVVSPTTNSVYALTATSPSNCTSSRNITVSVSGAAPVLTITASTNSICLGNTVSIAASGALSYTFSGGISNNVSFTPVATSTYVVQGQNGCGTSSTAVTITVSALPVVAITSTNVVCAGSTATLSGGGATTYTWQPGNLVGANVVVAPQNNTTYTVLGFTGACGGINTVSVSTNPVPSLTVTVSHFTLCAGESSTITATGASSYTWTPGGLGSSIVVSPLIPTSYIVVGENSFGCTSSAQQGVVAYAGPNMNIAASSTLICAGGVVTLNSSGATTYLWNTGATTAITTATPASTTVYTVVGSAPGNPCSTTKTIEINVFTATISVSSPTAICLGESTTLTASGANTYNWSNGGSGSSISVNPTSTTIYTVNGVSSMGSGTCASSAITEVTVNPLPSVVAASSRTNICRTESTEITVSGANTYSWSTSSTATSIVVSPTIQTTYTVLGTDANGCKNTGSILIRVFGCLGLEENAAAFNVINIYPNPSSGEFKISAEQNMSLVLINELGQLVKEIELNAENGYSAEIKGLSKGVYFINSKNAELQFNKKIVVQ